MRKDNVISTLIVINFIEVVLVFILVLFVLTNN